MASQQLKIASLMEMKPNRTSLGRNPLNDALCRNPDIVLNEHGSGRSILRDASYWNPNMVSNEQGPDRHHLSDVLHRHPDVVSSEQGSSHYTRRVRGVRKLAGEFRIRVGSWNVGSLTGKLRELVNVTVRKRVNIMCVQETKWTGKKANEVENTDFKLWYTGTERNKNCVGILID